jgi:hypothetical protein
VEDTSVGPVGMRQHLTLKTQNCFSRYDKRGCFFRQNYAHVAVNAYVISDLTYERIMLAFDNVHKHWFSRNKTYIRVQRNKFIKIVKFHFSRVWRCGIVMTQLVLLMRLKGEKKTRSVGPTVWPIKFILGL